MAGARRVTPAPPPGLCGTCRHARSIENRRGSRFHLCLLAATDPAFPRYPVLPVLSCRGYAPRGRGPKDTPRSERPSDG